MFSDVVARGVDIHACNYRPRPCRRPCRVLPRRAGPDGGQRATGSARRRERRVAESRTDRVPAEIGFAYDGRRVAVRKIVGVPEPVHAFQKAE
jgi:hypothetical protein